MSNETDEPSVMGAGCGLSPMPTADDRKAAWRAIYMATLMKHAGLDEIAAKDCYDAGSDDYDFTDDPEQAALEEIAEMREQVDRDYKDLLAVLYALRDMPTTPDPRVLNLLSKAGKFPDDWETGKRAYRRRT